MSVAKAPREKETLVDENGSLVVYYPHFLAEEVASALLCELSDEVPWRLETDDFGLQDRLTCYMGDAGCTFTYVGLENLPGAWHPKVQSLCAEVSQFIGQELTGCLLNNYQAGQGSIPWHSDEVRAHGESRCIATVSLGGPRPFQLKHQADPDREVIERWLLPGSLLLMQGETQAHWRHRLPLPSSPCERRSDGTHTPDATGAAASWVAPPRISLTFRSIIPGWEASNVNNNNCPAP